MSLDCTVSTANAQSPNKKTLSLDYRKLYDDYQANPINADAKYKDKVLALTGKVAEIGRSVVGSPYVAFVVDYESGNVVFYFRKSEEGKIAALTKGQSVTIIGKCKGTGLLNAIVQLDDCVIAPVQLADFFEVAKIGTPSNIQDAINKGVDVNAQDVGTEENWQDVSGKTALMYAAEYNPNPAMITVLLKAGADVKAQDEAGRTALACAAIGSASPDVITILVEAGANLEAQDVVGMTPLMYAAEYNSSAPIITTLLKAGANVRARAEKMLGYTPLIYAAMSNKNPEVIAILLRGRADINEPDSLLNGTPLLYAAANNENPQIISALLKAGANLEAQNTDGVTPLMAAANHNSSEVVNLLLQAGANIEHRNKSKKTALMFAAEKNPDPEVIAVLLIAGADASAKDNGGKTAVDYASGNEKLRGTTAYDELIKANQAKNQPIKSGSSVVQLSTSSQGTELWPIEGTWEVMANGIGKMTFLFERQQWDTKTLGVERFAFGHLLANFDWTITYDRVSDTLDAENQGQYRVVWIDNYHFRTEGALMFKNAIWTKQ